MIRIDHINLAGLWLGWGRKLEGGSSEAGIGANKRGVIFWTREGRSTYILAFWPLGLHHYANGDHAFKYRRVW